MSERAYDDRQGCRFKSVTTLVVGASMADDPGKSKNWDLGWKRSRGCSSLVKRQELGILCDCVNVGLLKCSPT